MPECPVFRRIRIPDIQFSDIHCIKNNTRSLSRFSYPCLVQASASSLFGSCNKQCKQWKKCNKQCSNGKKCNKQMQTIVQISDVFSVWKLNYGIEPNNFCSVLYIGDQTERLNKPNSPNVWNPNVCKPNTKKFGFRHCSDFRRSDFGIPL